MLSQNSKQQTRFNKAFGLADGWIANVYLSNNFAFTRLRFSSEAGSVFLVSLMGNDPYH